MRTRAWLARFAALRRAPAVVGMRTSGGQLISSTGGRVHSSSSRLLPDPATIAIDLPASRPLPPPTATKLSAACSRYAAAPATMLRSVGLASTSPKRRGCRPAAASESKSPPTTGVPAGAGKEEGTGMAERGSKAVPDARGRGAPLKPLSATRSGRFEPRSRSLAGSSAARPAPNVTGTGKAQSAATLERPRLLFGNSARRDEIALCMKSVWWVRLLVPTRPPRLATVCTTRRTSGASSLRGARACSARPSLRTSRTSRCASRLGPRLSCTI